jgi:hypothetical protein
MTNVEVWRSIERILGRTVPGWMKGHFERRGHLEGMDDEENLEMLVEDVRDLFESMEAPDGVPLLRATGATADTAEARTLLPLTREWFPSCPQLEDRGEAVAHLLAHGAGWEDAVCRFRAEFLGSKLLTLDEHDRFLNSPALRLFSKGDLEQWGVPLVGHTAVILEEERSTNDNGTVQRRVSVRIDPPGITRESHHWVTQIVETEALGVPRRAVYALPCILWTDAEGGEGRQQVVAGSVLDELHRIAVWLAHRYGWEEEQAVCFILTGCPPASVPIQSQVEFTSRGCFTQATITMRVAAWVPAEVVQRSYGEVQRMYFPVRERIRPLSEKACGVYRFVLERTNGQGEHPSWARLRDEWNASCPKSWRYSSKDQFWKAYQRVAESIVLPQPITAGRRPRTTAARKKRLARRSAGLGYSPACERRAACG